MSTLSRMLLYGRRLARFADVLRDIAGLFRVCGPRVALRWSALVASHLAEIARSGNLQVVDAAMGAGPFRCSRKQATALLAGPQVISGIREIWCRDVYLGRDLTIRDGDVVLDLGANMGNFTMLALAQGPGVRVVAVEPNRLLNDVMRAQLRLNGWESRCTLLTGFVGQLSVKVAPLEYQGADPGSSAITESTLLDCAGRGELGFVKCDIEGGEYALFHSSSQLLACSKQIAFELHYEEGDKDALLATLASIGFAVNCERPGELDGVYHASRG